MKDWTRVTTIMILLGTVIMFQACSEKSNSKKTPTYAGELVDNNFNMTGAYHFAQYHKAIRTNEGEELPRYKANYKLEEYQAAIGRLRASGKSRSTLDWIERGPGNIAGRARSLWVDPSDETGMTVLVGSVGGGVWKTTDGGNSWENLTNELPNLAASRVVGAPSDPNTIYLGTGEDYGAGDEIYGSGIWKSTDGGQTWNVIPTSFKNASFGSINSLLVNPEDAEHIIFASRVNRNENVQGLSSFIGVSTNGGQTISAPYTISPGNIQQIVAHPENFNILLGTVNSEGVIKSTNGGRNWSSIWSTSDFTRMEIAISPLNPDYVFMSGYNASDTSSTSSFLFSSDGGDNFKKVQGEVRILDYLGGQGWYNNSIVAHPTDTTTAIVGGAGLLIELKVLDPNTSEATHTASVRPLSDGYIQYERFDTTLFPGLDSKGVHVDHHYLYAQTIGENTYLYGVNDGGFAMSTDGGENFLQTGDLFGSEATMPTGKGLNTAQFYGADKANGVDRYVGGMQDNGSWHTQDNPDASTDWELSLFGDGFECAWSYGDVNKFMVSLQFGGIVRTTDGGQSFEACWPPNYSGGQDNTFPFLTRLANSKHEPDLVFTPSNLGLYRTVDFATVRPENASSGTGNWDLISMPGWFNQNSMVRISVAQPDVVWAARSLNGQAGVSVDRGLTFAEIAAYEHSPGTVTNIATHPFRDSTAYFLFSQGDGPKIVVTDDLGQTFRDISGFNRVGVENSGNGFPDVAVYSLLVMPYDENIIWAGTDIGIFESTDGGQSWNYADNGLPAVSVWDMKIVNDEIVVATHGRGVWSVSIPELEGYEPRPVPSLIATKYALDGNVNGIYKLRAAAESAKITVTYEVDGEKRVRQFDIEDVNTIGEDLFFSNLIEDIPEDEIIPASIQLQTSVDGELLNSYSTTLLFNVDADDPVDEYENNFDQGQTDFALDGLRYVQPSSFDSKGLDSPHPYAQLTTYRAVFQKPIIVTEETNTVAFDEIALIEPGAAGTTFGHPDFWDYIFIEGTKDGIVWDTIEGYDCRLFPVWETAYNNGLSGQDSNTPGNPNLVQRHVINLEDHYDIGDKVYLAFTMYSDPFAFGWGWRIDNFIVGNPSVNTLDIIDEQGFNVRVIANPVRDFINLELVNNEGPRDIRYNVLDLNGRLVHGGKILNKYSGTSIEQIDVSNLPSGLYLVNIQWMNKQQAIRVVKQ